jgi:hypothetical protein
LRSSRSTIDALSAIAFSKVGSGLNCSTCTWTTIGSAPGLRRSLTSMLRPALSRNERIS